MAVAKAAEQRRGRWHPPRPRRPRLGELVQIDGSQHDWLEGRGTRCTLIAFIDDAASRVMYARFVPVESSQAYLDALRAYVGACGRALALYSDRHGIFAKHDPEVREPTPFQRALVSLGIAGIQALTPQANRSWPSTTSSIVRGGHWAMNGYRESRVADSRRSPPPRGEGLKERERTRRHSCSGVAVAMSVRAGSSPPARGSLPRRAVPPRRPGRSL